MDEAAWLASDDPQAMLAFVTQRDVVDQSLCIEGVSDRKLRLFAIAVRTASGRSGRALEEVSRHLPADKWAADWASRVEGTVSATIPQAQKSAILRDVVGNPFRPVKLPKRYVQSCPPKCLVGGQGRVSLFPTSCGGCKTPWREECPWITPTVLSLAQAAYSGRWCEHCARTGRRSVDGSTCWVCHGTGRIEDGSLDPVRLAILADALEEAGCTEEALLRHLRSQVLCPGCSRDNDTEWYGTEWYGGGGGWCAYCDNSGPELHWIAAAELRKKDKHLDPGPHVRGCWAVDLLLGEE